jgi:hypothetical protein
MRLDTLPSMKEAAALDRSLVSDILIRGNYDEPSK